MGDTIYKSDFLLEEEEEFSKRLKEETKLLKKLFESREFKYTEKPSLGLEVEAWLVDKDQIPSPTNNNFLKEMDSNKVTEELSKFNFEINIDPQTFQNGCFKNTSKQLSNIWKKCKKVTESMDTFPVLIGIHPLIKQQDLQLENLSEGYRYEALNKQLLKARDGKLIRLDIKGKDHFRDEIDHIMFESAATSIQVHMQTNQETAKRLYNASLILSAPAIAIAANSPYLFGNDLWDDTRIPLFEQTIQATHFRDRKGKEIGRVTLGTGYIKNSFLELFLENLSGYPPLLPVLFDDKVENLRHLRFHNGTLWRWVRPIIGFDAGKKPHLRIEQRSMSSGPTIDDIISNMAFSVGLTNYFATMEAPPEESMTFTDCKNNFYEAAKNGLSAKVRWFGKEVDIDDLILNDLIGKAKEGLLSQNIDKDEVMFYIDENIRQRTLKGQNGSRWQRSFLETHGRNFQALMEAYYSNQEKGIPSHKWKI